MTTTRDHTPVLLQEAVEALRPDRGGVFIDCTFGRGGHSRALLARLGTQGQLLALDRDPDAYAVGKGLEAEDKRFSMVRHAFGELRAATDEILAGRQVDGVLFDLGVSSPQLDDASRGFSFQADGPLDMRMDPDHGTSAAQWLMTVGEKALVDVLREFGEERYARRVARAILAERERCPIESTGQLAELVKRAMPARERGKNPATRTFQALRIRANDELDQLASGLEDATSMLKPAGRLAVISFHSLEDRVVKRFIRREAYPDSGPFPVPVHQVEPRLCPVGKPIRPSAEECASNPRARSATLRVAERLS